MKSLTRSALDLHRFTPEILSALIAAIDVNDLVDFDAPPPIPVSFDIAPDQFIGGFRLSRQLWQERFDPSALAALAVDLRRGRSMDEGARSWFKQVRASFKHLRFAFFLYSSGHRSPPMLSLMTLVMGELQDAVRVGRARDVRRHATSLQLLLTRPLRVVLIRETDRLMPTDAAGFRRFTLSQVASLQPVLAPSTVGAHAFHAARKVVSRQVSFHDDMRTLHPAAEQSSEHRAMARWLATLNGLMGKFHDDLVARHADGSFDYRRDLFELPDVIRVRLQQMVALYLGTSSSNPPSA